MTSSEGDTENDNWVMRYDAQYFGKMERRPVSAKPERDGCYFVDFGTKFRPGPSSAALFINGEWCRTNKVPFKAKVTHWTRLLDIPPVNLPKAWEATGGGVGEA